MALAALLQGGGAAYYLNCLLVRPWAWARTLLLAGGGDSSSGLGAVAGAGVSCVHAAYALLTLLTVLCLVGRCIAATSLASRVSSGGGSTCRSRCM